MNFLYEPWPWYVAGPIIGITVPILLILGNKRLGVSSTLRHICASCMPSTRIPLFRYDWKKESWSLVFVAGILIGGLIAGYFFRNPEPVQLSQKTVDYLNEYGVGVGQGEILPAVIFNWQSLFTLRGFLMMVVGGFLVGFGTRYAQGCTSGHGIMGLGSLQWPSLVATTSFFIGGILFSRYILPHILLL